MKTNMNYHCDSCGEDTVASMEIGSPQLYVECSKCGSPMKRRAKAPEVAMPQDETVRWANSKMLHSSMPSGQVRTLV